MPCAVYSSTDTIPPGYLLHMFTFSRIASATTICGSSPLSHIRKKLAPEPKLFSHTAILHICRIVT